MTSQQSWKKRKMFLRSFLLSQMFLEHIKNCNALNIK